MHLWYLGNFSDTRLVKFMCYITMFSSLRSDVILTFIFLLGQLLLLFVVILRLISFGHIWFTLIGCLGEIPEFGTMWSVCVTLFHLVCKEDLHKRKCWSCKRFIGIHYSVFLSPVRKQRFYDYTMCLDWYGVPDLSQFEWKPFSWPITGLFTIYS